ncbi:protein-export chaperone SecB [Pseudomonas gingeri]|uniref:protein-export chaperone SecB n=1 Tax=Pseudomonas gingeri TaxID=117681 RepID=UPI0015BB18B5|nr:protein-export chaperone SecB [Pseudomonas gingeri]NWE68976.1 protein-export chaperone SecB [Pseudomonas gingeri]
MKAAKFTLESLFFPEVSVKANQRFSPESKELPTEPEIVVYVHRRGDHSFHVGVRLTLSAEFDSDRYGLEVLGIGTFNTDTSLADEQSVALIARSGPNIVYSSIRDMVATVTGRGPWSEYYLQPKIIGPEDFASPDSEEEED